MKRLASVSLALLAVVLFPLLIWAALFAATRQPLLQAAKRFGAVLLALLASVSAPILIWVGVGVAAAQRIRERRLELKPFRTIEELLTAAGLRVRSELLEGVAPVELVLARQPLSDIQELIARAGL